MFPSRRKIRATYTENRDVRSTRFISKTCARPLCSVRSMRVGVIAIGLLQNIDKRDHDHASELVNAIGPSHCVGVFEKQAASSENCTTAALERARGMLSSGGGTAEVRLVTPAELQAASRSCRSVTSTAPNPQYCPGFLLQFHKVALAFRMLQRAEARDGVRFEAVMRLRTDLTLLVSKHLLEQVAKAAATSSSLMLQHDFVWIASRGIADHVANAWGTMERLSLLRRGLGASPTLAALRQLDWTALSHSCWVHQSNFGRCLPLPADWEKSGGWNAHRVAQIARNASVLEAALDEDSRVWLGAHGALCPHVRRAAGIGTARTLGHSDEPEVKLGLALYSRPGGARPMPPLHGDNCTNFVRYGPDHQKASSRRTC